MKKWRVRVHVILNTIRSNNIQTNNTFSQSQLVFQLFINNIGAHVVYLHVFYIDKSKVLLK